VASLASERKVVQSPLIKYAVEAGWTYLSREEALRLRQGDTGILLLDVFYRQVQRLNPGMVGQAEAREIARRLSIIAPSIEGDLEAWEFLNGLKTIFVPSERRERNIRLLDPDHPDANTFHVTDEFSFSNGVKTNRPDVVFLINGVPVLVVETKAATKIDGINEALEQIRRYHRESPELLAILQLYAVTHLVQYYYGATWNLARKSCFNWRDEQARQAGDFETLVKSFVAPRRILRILTEFILFTRRDDELAKVVLRPHQMRAVEKVVRRAQDSEKRRGLIWHTQGSGKTYTMITVAKQLIEEPALRNPTILMLVDRNELEQQLFKNLSEVGFRQLTVARSKKHLQQLLRSDQRGLIVSMIHKFDDVPANLNTRDNIFVLVDEAHRSTGGDLGNYLMGALPNATYFGFTGTPIDRTAYGKGTFKTFGGDDPQGYLDKYSIRESIDDGTTVPLNYAIAPNDLRVDEETLEREFLSLSELEGVTDVEELNRVLERAVTLRNMLKNPDRIDKVARYVAEHFRDTIEPMGYKAFLVAVDREACALYKEALDRYLPPEYSEVVISASQNDRELLVAHHLAPEQEERIRKDFRKPELLPTILIVTEKLLTGFDAPILYCMYLDKPMRDHVLLQAIARVNRPYEDSDGRRKPAGFVLDFIGIFDKLERALAFDSQDVSGVVHGLDVLQQRFAALMEQGRTKYLSIAGSLINDKAADALLEYFRDEEPRHEFYRYFAELEEDYEILSPDPWLRPYIDDYTSLTAIYRVVRGAYDPQQSVDRDLLHKTAELVAKHTESGLIHDPSQVYELNGEALQAIANEQTPPTVKIFNLVKTFYQLVEEQGAEAPYLIAIGERAAEIVHLFEERQLTTQETLDKLDELIKKYREEEQSPERRELPNDAHLVYWLLRYQGNDHAIDAGRAAKEAFTSHPHWRHNGDEERHVRVGLYKALRAARVKQPEMAGFVDRVLATLRKSPD